MCDQGGKNQSLAKILKITEDNLEFPDPFDESRTIIFSYDFNHGAKNLRNHTLDDKGTFVDENNQPTGEEFSSKG